MTAEHPGDLLHRLEARAHHLDAPLIEECAGPVDRAVLPEVVKPFPQQQGADGAQVVLHEFTQAGALIARLILPPFQEQPARVGCVNAGRIKITALLLSFAEVPRLYQRFTSRFNGCCSCSSFCSDRLTPKISRSLCSATSWPSYAVTSSGRRFGRPIDCS